MGNKTLWLSRISATTKSDELSLTLIRIIKHYPAQPSLKVVDVVKTQILLLPNLKNSTTALQHTGLLNIGLLFKKLKNGRETFVTW